MNEKQIKRRELILKGNLWKVILLLAVPVAMNNCINATYGLIDTYFVANIGTTELAAVGFVGPLNMMVRMVSLGLTIGGTTLIASEIGRKNYGKARNISMQLLIVALILGCVVAGYAFINSKEILTVAAASDQIMEVANLYFRITILSTPFVFFNAAFVSIKRADGDTLKTMWVNIIGMGIKTVLTYVMIFHLDMGVKSLAISTIIGTLFVTLYGIYDLFFKESLLKLSIKDSHLSWTVIKALIIIGIPIVIEKSSLSFSHVLMNKYVIGYGEEVLIGYTVTNRINSMFFGAVTGFGTGLSPIISQNLAAGQADRVKKAIKKAYVLALAVAATAITIVLLLRYPIAGSFAKGDEEVLRHIINAMTTYSISVLPWAIFQVTSGIFQGTGHTRYNMLISVFRIYAFRIPIVLFLMNFTPLQEYSIWYGMLISNTLTALVAIVLYYGKRNHLKLAVEA